jgi:hypothetical protein
VAEPNAVSAAERFVARLAQFDLDSKKTTELQLSSYRQDDRHSFFDNPC